ncbi:hypothetical protein L1987_02864 [Smallanthus sonchifolius]|uniref:Uncharacterized protein n=1 Tax=Smallanthus sonchifolius TaxID=185202 RepID=A0ACB9K941_9ASTR|nr:hypothetical protein L1987_02864 [Smallanthus sonchifolius]
MIKMEDFKGEAFLSFEGNVVWLEATRNPRSFSLYISIYHMIIIVNATIVHHLHPISEMMEKVGVMMINLVSLEFNSVKNPESRILPKSWHSH